MPYCVLTVATVARLIVVIGVASASSAHADLRDFGNWLVGCDSKAECAAIGTAEASTDPATPSVALRIGVDRTSLSGFEVAIIPLPYGAPTPRPITVTCLLCANDISASGNDRADRIELRGQRTLIPDMQGARWLDALGKGNAIAVAWADGSAINTIDKSAFLEAWKHLAQRRGDLMRNTLMANGLPSLQAGQPQQGRKRLTRPGGPCVRNSGDRAVDTEMPAQRNPRALQAIRAARKRNLLAGAMPPGQHPEHSLLSGVWRRRSTDRAGVTRWGS